MSRLGLIVLLLAGTPAVLHGQLQVVGIRDLAFGPVIQGIATAVAPSHPAKSGEFEVTAALGNQIRVRYTLPNRLNGPAGARLPISFSNSDALALETGPGSVPVTFNPHGNRNFTLTNGNRILFFLGGTVSPAGGQAIGSYTNTVVLTVTIL